MTSDDAPLVDLLAAYDAGLARGERTPPPEPSGGLPPELQARWDGARACLDLLEQAWPRGEHLTVPETRPLAEAGLPTRVGRFEVRGLLGNGSFGVVYLAFDPRLHRHVALKVPRPDRLPTPELRRRFVVEARAAAGLDHPHVVAVYESGEVGGVSYLVSAYCPGPTLAEWMRRHGRPVPAREAAALVATLAGAVGHAHQREVLHRDLKPANILMTAGSADPPPGPQAPLAAYVPKVVDFGLAKLLAETAEDTRTGDVVGTPRYMAPEQADGRTRDIGPPADVYALGVILYELLTGRPPVGGTTPLEVLDRVRTEEPPPPSRFAEVPPELEAVCLRCLHKYPGRRYATAAGFAEDLHRWLVGQPVASPPHRGLGRVGRPWATGRGAVLAGCVILSLFGSLFSSPNPAANPTAPPTASPRESFLRRVLRDLRNRHPVTLVGPVGGPGWSRWRTESDRAPLPAYQKKPLPLWSAHTCLLELLPDPQCSNYRFHAEVRHESLRGSAGLFFRADTSAVAGRKEERFYSVTFGPSTQVPRCVKVQLCRNPEFGGGFAQDSLYHHDLPSGPTPEEFWRGPRVAGALVAMPGPWPAPSFWAGLALGPDPDWHAMSVEVTPTGTTVLWDGWQVCRIPQTTEQEEAGRWWRVMREDGEALSQPPPFSPRGALGLIVIRADATFRNVVVEPLRGE
jgi:serine/threonine-protein kinase